MKTLPPPFLVSRNLFAAFTAIATTLLLAQNYATAQSDDFNDGDDAGWNRVNVIAPYGGANTYSFPNGPFGKGYRIQCTSSAPLLGACGDCGTARAFIYRTNYYTNFYVSVDIVNWNNNLDQALVLLARASGVTNALDPCPLGGTCPNGFGTVDGYVCNYDCNQDGVGSGDRRGGEFQINVVSGESPSTIAAAEVSLIPGKSYRLIFKGVGTALTGQIYDLEDLSAPIVTIQADDSSYTDGVSGLVSFSRDGTVTDVTFDNYLAAESDPNTDIAPAIRHSVPGIPHVVTRTPVKRFTNFHPPASGISFTARTFTANQINSSATKLYLNDVDASASLAPLPANGSTVSFSTAGGTLTANTVYSARIELEDVAGTSKSTNTFWFDTFSDAYLLIPPVKTIEAEDYNYSNGVYQLDPIAVSGSDVNSSQVNGNGVGYFNLAGTQGVDYSKPGGHYRTDWAEYRVDDRVQITQGSYSSVSHDEAADILDLNYPNPSRIHDTQRSQYAATNVFEYQVRLTSPGDWMNYTRVFPSTNFNVYLRCSSFGAQQIKLNAVTSDPTAAGQTTVPLGSFYVPNQIMRLNYRYQPLLALGAPAVVNLTGTKTIRLTMGGTAPKDERLTVLDYLLFVPTTAAVTPPVALQSSSIVNGTYTDAGGASVNVNTGTITVPVSGNATFYRIRSDVTTTISSITVSGGNVVIKYN